MNILAETWKTYASSIRLVLLFSIPFLISFLIPIVAYLPTYITAGGIFIRIGGLILNANALETAIIILAFFFSLLFLSFAYTAINIIVKAGKTHAGIATSVIRNTEKFTGRVFLILLLYSFLVFLAGIAGFYIGNEPLVTGIVGFFAFIPIFYAPAAVTIDNRSIKGAMAESARLVARKPSYFVIWFVLIAVVMSILDFIFTAVFGGQIGSYVLLVISSLFILPYFVIYQAHAYMRKFPILKH